MSLLLYGLYQTLKNQIKRKFSLQPEDLQNLLKYVSWFTTYKSYVWHLKQWKALGEADIDQKKNFIFFTTDKSKRLYHNASSTPKDIRKYLKIQGEELVEIDASNSQWFLLVALLEEKHKQFKKDERQVKKQVKDTLSKIQEQTKRLKPVDTNVRDINLISEEKNKLDNDNEVLQKDISELEGKI